MSIIKLANVHAPLMIFHTLSYHALHDQYLAVNLSLAVSHLCLALKLLRLSGLSFLIDMLGSPYRTTFTWSPFLANTADFFDSPDKRLGLLYPGNISPRYFHLPLGRRSTSLVVAIVVKLSSLIFRFRHFHTFT